MPDARFAPELFQASRCVGARIELAIAVVVVLPFVAETSATPAGAAPRDRRARRDRASRRASPEESCRRLGPRRARAGRRAGPRWISSASRAPMRARVVERSRSARFAECRKCSTIVAWPVHGDAILPSRASTRTRSRSSGRACGGATRTKRSSPSSARRRSGWALADDARVRGRPCGDGAPADRDRALRHVERREARSGPAAASLHQPGGAARSAAGARGGARPHADSARHRGAPGRMASKSLIWHTFGSLAAALREAGFDVPVGEERLERAIADGAVLARELGRLPKMADWKDARSARRDAAVRVAGLPHGRRSAGGLVGVPVPRPRAPARGGRAVAQDGTV